MSTATAPATTAATDRPDDLAPFRALLAELVERHKGQRGLGRATGVNQAFIGKLLRGEQRPGLDTLNKIAAACGYTVEELLAGERRRPPAEAKPYAGLQLDQILVVRNARESFDAEAIEELAASIFENGLLQAVLVSPDILAAAGAAAAAETTSAAAPDATPATTPDGRPLLGLVAGERRYRALCLLAERDPAWFAAAFGPDSPGGGVPHVVRRYADPAAALIDGLTENLARRDISAAELTLGLVEAQAATGLDDATLARRLGRGVSQVQQHLRIARRLPERDPQAWADYRAGRLLFVKARELSMDARPPAELPDGSHADDTQPADTPSPLHPEEPSAPAEGVSKDAAQDTERAPAPGEANEHGVIRPTEIVTVWRGHWPNMFASIVLAESEDGWRWQANWGLSSRGRGGPIKVEDAPLATREGAVQAAAAELGAALQQLATHAGTLREDRRHARSVLHALSHYLGPDDRALAVIPDDPEPKRPAMQADTGLDLDPGTEQDFEDDEDEDGPPRPLRDPAVPPPPCSLDALRMALAHPDPHDAGAGMRPELVALALAVDALAHATDLVAIEPGHEPHHRAAVEQASQPNPTLEARLWSVWREFAGLPSRADRLRHLIELGRADLAGLLALLRQVVAVRLGPLDPTPGQELLRLLATELGVPLIETATDPEGQPDA
jgi:ParB-like chromosome segregation protein Spo0J/DNA-binding phage protein